MDTHTKKKLGVWLSVAGILLVLAVYGGVYAVTFTLPMPLPMFLLLEGFVFAGGLGVLIAAWYRIKEINGGEEDDLSQY